MKTILCRAALMVAPIALFGADAEAGVSIELDPKDSKFTESQAPEKFQ